MPQRFKVALLIETSNAYARGLLDGAIEFVRRQGAWSVYLPEQERGAKPPSWLANWDGDGILARIENDAIAQAVLSAGLPVVDVSAARHLENVPWVETEDEAIAKLAADHLIERGFRRMGYCGRPEFNWSRWREEHFSKTVIDAGCEYYVFPAAMDRPSRERRKAIAAPEWSDERSQLELWLKELPKPIGIMCCYDIQAQRLLDLCRELDIAVPEEIAVIGVDNDRILCELSSPSLTSVAPNAHRAGFEAARLLDQMMRGQAIAPVPHLIKPLGIETRQSTDILAIDDPDVARALRFIREHACDGINVADVIRHLDTSRRVLEHRFAQHVGRTPHAEIQRVRMERVKSLLNQPGLTLMEIAARTGFEHIEYLSTAFKRETGLSPSQFRKSQVQVTSPNSTTSPNRGPSSDAKR